MEDDDSARILTQAFEWKVAVERHRLPAFPQLPLSSFKKPQSSALPLAVLSDNTFHI